MITCPICLVCLLLCLDFAILFDVDMLIGLEDTDFVFWELNAVGSKSVLEHLWRDTHGVR